MTLFKRWDRIIGWAVFAIAALVYLMTMEPVSSLWDCSEFIATSYKLEVGHPPGAPLFMMLARLATLFAFGNPDYVAMAVNSMNSIASAFCILFLFWTITHMARRLVSRNGGEMTTSNTIAVLGAGLVGALAYTFTDSFWFSAIEGEVYALSSMFTALVVWLMFKWEEQADEPHNMRWIVLIAYLMGLSIGVHILNLLTVPALVFVYYFRKTDRVTIKGLSLATLVAGAILLVFNAIIIPYTVYIGAQFDLLFVNVIGLPVNSGMVFFALALIGAMGWGAWYTHKMGRPLLNVILLSMTMVLIGYSSYASVTIRAAANPPMNSNNPNNPHALLSFLNRDQYGARPLIYGANYSAPPEGYVEKEFYYLNHDGKYKHSSTVTGYTHSSEFMQLFPRMWDYRKGDREYIQWGAYRTKTDARRDDKGEVVRDEKGRPIYEEVLDFGREILLNDGERQHKVVVPTFAENLNFFFTYQLSYMYWRYFLWNFVGRQSDIQPMGSTITDGNWLSGIKFIDQKYLGPQDNLPSEIANNKARNTYFFLPFILGLIGLLYQLNRDQKNFAVTMWLFIMMGLALVVYFNSSPGEPRERDYVYAGSFYAFCIWIGFGVLALHELFSKMLKGKGSTAAVAATVICMAVPTILVAQNWDDHDRSHRYISRDIGWNYLQSTLPNSIIMNYGDNDTFPLWNNQEVYGVRPDVRIMNTSYLGGEWYIDQMRVKSHDSEPVPFSLPKAKYTFMNDFVEVVDRVGGATIEAKEVIGFVASDDPRTKLEAPDGSMSDYIPAKRIGIPVNKDNAIASGIVAEKDRDLMVDTVFVNLRKKSLDRPQLMILDMLANFDWKRPIYMTQVYVLQDLGLMDYLQFDGYAYRLVPILTPAKSPWEVGRIDTDYTAPLLRGEGERGYRYGNLNDKRVYADHFIQYNLSASRARDAFARVAKELLNQKRVEEAEALLDQGLEKMPTWQIRFTDTNTYPFLEAYYAASALGSDTAAAKGDALMREYARTLIEYIDYYLAFEGAQGDMVASVVDDKLNQLGDIYYLAGYANRKELLAELNAYYRELGVSEDNLIGDKPKPTDSLIP